VAKLLREEHFSLQGNAKTAEGARHPDRDAQFRYINGQARDHLAAGQPVAAWAPRRNRTPAASRTAGGGSPEPVNVYDFIGKEKGKAIPYGVYDVGANAGPPRLEYDPGGV
jgi:Rhodopirellula transposase DDE domain